MSADAEMMMGKEKRDPSKFIAEVVKWRVLDQTIAEARSKFADMPPEAVEALIDEAVAATRQSVLTLTLPNKHRHPRA
jgi:hypothetical protein